MAPGFGVVPGLPQHPPIGDEFMGEGGQACGQGKGFNVFLCFSVPTVCEACNFVSLDAIAALSPSVCLPASAK